MVVVVWGALLLCCGTVVVEIRGIGENFHFGDPVVDNVLPAGGGCELLAAASELCDEFNSSPTASIASTMAPTRSFQAGPRFMSDLTRILLSTRKSRLHVRNRDIQRLEPATVRQQCEPSLMGDAGILECDSEVVAQLEASEPIPQ